MKKHDGGGEGCNKSIGNFKPKNSQSYCLQFLYAQHLDEFIYIYNVKNINHQMPLMMKLQITKYSCVFIRLGYEDPRKLQSIVTYRSVKII